MKFEVTEQKGNKLSIEYDELFEDTVCSLMGWDKLTEFRLQYFVNETIYDFINRKNIKTKKPKKKKR
tara:strand:+ start:608 stop:808 length:201 start_codon:yes stop_codon:yes gene_type:complete